VSTLLLILLVLTIGVVFTLAVHGIRALLPLVRSGNVHMPADDPALGGKAGAKPSVGHSSVAVVEASRRRKDSEDDRQNGLQVGRVHSLLEPRGLVLANEVGFAAIWQGPGDSPPIGAPVRLKPGPEEHIYLAFHLDDEPDSVDFAQDVYPPARRG